MENSKLQIYPKQQLGHRAEYIDFTKASQTLCKIRIGDIGNWEEEQTCKACGERGKLHEHIVGRCRAIDTERRQAGFTEHPAQWKEQLNEQGAKTAVHRLVSKWTEKETMRENGEEE